MTSRSAPPWLRNRNSAVTLLKALFLIVVVLAIVLPFLYVLEVSLLTRKEVIATAGAVIIPHAFSIAAYADILSGTVVQRSLIISVSITIVGTLLSVLVTTGLAYGLSRPTMPGRRVLLILVLLTFLFTPGLIPTYLMVKELHLLNSYGSLIFPGLVSTFNFVVLRNFFMNIPQEIIDSAQIDGANNLDILRHITIPLSRAAMAVIGLFYAVGYWNSFFNALLYLNNASMWPIQLVLRQYVLQGNTIPTAAAAQAQAAVVPPAASIQMAIVIVAMVPILIVYPFLQRYFATGVLTGAIKS
ncbi:MAG: carbohydrate ABC transporter permease [Chloroflexi bacterium]|nr:carbohydrate ABC transporter permease [Chloroflexota bacterium]